MLYFMMISRKFRKCRLNAHTKVLLDASLNILSPTISLCTLSTPVPLSILTTTTINMLKLYTFVSLQFRQAEDLRALLFLLR
ncbi:hypothetical protein BC829DRAFT_189205 [Chytridium lagenaria]|nr:hypothetical protein BC829DRAFT_189205 [Chytridium lagenaria]